LNIVGGNSLVMEKAKKLRDTKIVEKGLQRKYNAFISYITIMELSAHLTAWFLLGEVIKSGFGYTYFKRERQKHNLTSEQKETIGKIVNFYQTSKDVSYVEIVGIGEAFFSKIKLLVDNCIEFEDALHFIFATGAECDYFATKDEEFRSRMQKVISEKIIEIPNHPEIIKPQSILKKLK
jgi:hypothetical protein